MGANDGAANYVVYAEPMDGPALSSTRTGPETEGMQSSGKRLAI